MKTLGFTRRQLAVTLAWQASATAVIGIVIGVPLGMATGRELWILFARNIDVVPQPSVPLSVLFVALAALVLANVVAAIPGRGCSGYTGRHRTATGMSRSLGPLGSVVSHQEVGATTPRFSSDDRGPECPDLRWQSYRTLKRGQSTELGLGQLRRFNLVARCRMRDQIVVETQEYYAHPSRKPLE